MRSYRLDRPPRALRRSSVHLDNVALVPASLLPFREHWQRVANDLPRGGILIILPDHAKQQRVAQAVAWQLRQQGQRVRVIDESFPIGTP